jgi:hypothetical protein
MKKTLVAVLAVLCMLAFTVPAFAATDTFADVPAKHWAYDAVKQLAKAGIVEGYGDGTFRGDRTMTRYEMAQIVANAMTKAAKADAQNKALIEKLAQEFNAELVSLGARVSKLEAKSKVNFFVDNRLQYNYTSLKNTDPTTDKAFGGTNGIDNQSQFMERLRIYWNIQTADWTWDARMVQAKWNFQTAAGSDTFRLDRFWVTNPNLFGGKVEMGKQMLYPGKGGFYGNTGDTDMIQYTAKLGDLQLRLGDGRNGTDVAFAEFVYRPTKTMDIGGFILKQDQVAGVKDYDIKSINGAVELAPNFALSAEWAKNSASLYDGKTGYWVALQSKYKATNFMPALFTSMVNPFVVGDSGWAVSYRHLPTGVSGNANRGSFSWVPLTTDADGSWMNNYNNVNAWRVDYLTVPWKGVQWTLTYENVKPISPAAGQNWTNNNFQTTFNFFF